MSKRGDQWLFFAEDVHKHIETYTVSQYGDSPDDQVEHYSADDCVKQAMKYLHRHGKNSRPGQEVLDMMKAAHYCQLAAQKIEEETNVAGKTVL